MSLSDLLGRVSDCIEPADENNCFANPSDNAQEPDCDEWANGFVCNTPNILKKINWMFRSLTCAIRSFDSRVTDLENQGAPSISDIVMLPAAYPMWNKFNSDVASVDLIALPSSIPSSANHLIVRVSVRMINRIETTQTDGFLIRLIVNDIDIGEVELAYSDIDIADTFNGDFHIPKSFSGFDDDMKVQLFSQSGSVGDPPLPANWQFKSKGSIVGYF